MKHINQYTIEQLLLFEEVQEDVYAEELRQNQDFKTCYECNETLPIEEFPPATYMHTTKGQTEPKWRRRQCKGCANKHHKIRQELVKLHPYPNGDYECPVCLEGRVHSVTGVERKWNLDHCHDSNTFRGFLCSSCNKAMGFFGDDIAIFERVIKYLNKHREELYEEGKKEKELRHVST